jgi:type III restriction enzyme
MLRAGLSKLRILEEAFTKYDETKHPKMLIVCEDTNVVPFVRDFLKQEEGFADDELMEIHSNKKGEVTQAEWADIKQKLFNMDKNKNPRVIISVLMLREGFDVNNICVIVPLRSSTSFILLEQVMGRGLRLMWRGNPQYDEMREKNRINLLKKRIEPDNYMDLLYIIEHPEYEKFYESELSPEDIAEVKEDLDKERVMGDLINVKLKEDYQEYDLFWPIIIQDKEEELKPIDLNLDNLDIYPIHLSELKKLFGTKGDKFISKELTKETKFGEYEVTAEIFSAKSYQQFIQKMVNSVSVISVQTGKRKGSEQKFPIMQINTARIAKLTDEYIRHKLFNEEFDPLEGNNWRILLSTGAKIIEHIRKNISKAIYNLQNSLDVKEAKIIKKYFSEIKEIKMRETYALEVAKTIYPKSSYPSNKGGFEKAFIEFIDADSKVERFKDKRIRLSICKYYLC